MITGTISAETESMRHAAEVRLRAQSNELKRFHDKICQRVTERERQNRLEAQRAQKNLDAKCAKVFSTTVQPTGNSVTTRLSTRPYFQKLIKDKKAILKMPRSEMIYCGLLNLRAIKKYPTTTNMGVMKAKL
ncbi:uncharacterized protein PITG_02618 [Phytophthora infestans T30-4]|uniref:Uncharacterized protein n=1 Tax=Phytophthora infestans (strain T30-4) TaxID=403677 RepID=D0MWS9_PHYIT|nr:uncharacterized protein PITG_02618 [Phytophthora infestans T30-4]EEY64092.1 conserved hypothetical protein [Phytophthora infestans T30-4]|eukprot:XP_002907528.1 conserved hypothetical protein [Phytophthora infestans T30-4]